MTVRHKPILPRRPEPVKGKRRGAGEHHVMLSAEQQEALVQWQKDFKKVLPELQKTAVVAQRLFQEMLDASTWQIAVDEQPAGVEEPKMWTVGHVKVNYVDHIETRGDSG